MSLSSSWTDLPAEGRSGAVPAWPLNPLDGVDAERELEIWRELWAAPQAVAWERLGWTRSIARYCRLLLIVEGPSAKTGLLKEVRQLEDRLGLSATALLRNRWRIVDTVAHFRPAPDHEQPRRSSVVVGQVDQKS